MQKLGKFIPTALNLAKSASADPAAGKLAGKAGQGLGGLSLQATSLKPPGVGMRRSLVSSSSSSSMGETAQTSVRSRAVSSMPPGAARKAALPQERDLKGANAAAQSRVDEAATGSRRLDVGAQDVAEPTTDELHAQMYEHSPLPGAQDMAKAQERVREEERFSTVVEQAHALGDTVDARQAFMDPDLLRLSQAELAEIRAYKEQQTGGLVKRPTIALDSDDWRQAVKQFMPEGADMLYVYTAEEVNEIARSQGKDPPWKTQTKVIAARFPAGTKLWQVASDKRNAQGQSQVGGLLAGKKYFGDWFLRSQPGDANEARFLAAIRPVYKDKLSHAAYLELGRDVTVLFGIAGEMPDGLPGGAAQVLCTDKAAMEVLHVVTLAPETGSKPDPDQAGR